MGFTIDLFQGLLFIPGTKLKRVVSDIDSLIEANCCTARELSALAGRINSFNLAVGYVTTLMRKFIDMSIVLQPRFSLSDSVKEELSFWKENVRSLDGRPIGRHVSRSRSIVYSDASDLGTANEMFRSSTWRELKSIFVSLVFP